MFADRPSAPVKMTDSAIMLNAQLSKLLLRTPGAFSAISATLHTIAMDENVIHNIISVDMGRLPPTKHQAMTEPSETAMGRTQVIAEVKMEPTRTTHA